MSAYKRARRHTPRAAAKWERWGAKKVAVKVRSSDELYEIAALADAKRVVNAVIHDAGRTQIAAGSATVVAVGPAPESAVNEITGRLKLL